MSPLPRPSRFSHRAAPPQLAALAVLAGALALGPTASASEGVREINQTCAIQTGCFSGDGAGLPVAIDGSAGRSYRLTSDLVVPDANTDGIQITSDQISLDLAGFEIRGPVVCPGIPIACTPNNGTGSGVRDVSFAQFGTSVRNGTIRGMGQFGVALGFQAELTGLRVRTNGSSGIIASFGSAISGNTAYRNGGDGIGTSGGVVISDNVAYQNGDDGIFSIDGSGVAGNTAYGNGGDGIDVGAGATVSGNTTYSNGSDGIQAGAGCIVQGNTVRSNTGFGLNLGAQSGYRENVASSNAAGAVGGSGFVNLGNNACNGSTVCP